MHKNRLDGVTIQSMFTLAEQGVPKYKIAKQLGTSSTTVQKYLQGKKIEIKPEHETITYTPEYHREIEPEIHEEQFVYKGYSFSINYTTQKFTFEISQNIIDILSDQTFDMIPRLIKLGEDIVAVRIFALKKINEHKKAKETLPIKYGRPVTRVVEGNGQ